MGPETSGPIWRMSLGDVRGLDDDFGGDEVEEFQSIEEGASRGDFLPSEGTSSDATQAPGVDVSDTAAATAKLGEVLLDFTELVEKTVSELNERAVDVKDVKNIGDKIKKPQSVQVGGDASALQGAGDTVSSAEKSFSAEDCLPLKNFFHEGFEDTFEATEKLAKILDEASADVVDALATDKMDSSDG